MIIRYLTRVRRVVLQDLDGHDLVGALLPAFGHLPESASSEELQDLILKSELIVNKGITFVIWYRKFCKCNLNSLRHIKLLS
jgi:hypothetical protein